MTEDTYNDFDGLEVDKKSKAFLDLMSMDRWSSFTPVFGSLTVIGATAYSGLYRVDGATIDFQVKFSAATSVASVAGTDYLNLPRTAKGLSGWGVMTNDTTNIAVGNCHLDVATSRLYLPTQVASGNVFLLYGKYQITG